ncbi:MAG: hypothetical protein QM523_07735 [Candidatus Pacebacteria bacterium]|nr:hypothetical protein [Candidatus Paceibacterota bacterium]
MLFFDQWINRLIEFSLHPYFPRSSRIVILIIIMAVVWIGWITIGSLVKNYRRPRGGTPRRR